MKNYTKPELNVIKFSVEDIITASSGGSNPTCPNEGGMDDF